MYGVIGCGSLGRAVIGSALRRGISRVHVLDPRISFSHEGKLVVHANLESIAKACSTVYLCVKPRDFSGLLMGSSEIWKHHHNVVSMGNGIRIQHLMKWTGQEAVFVGMPNLAIQEGLGAIFFYTKCGEGKRQEEVQRPFDPESICWISTEEKMVGVMALSGCGPAWVSVYMKSLYRIGRELGLEEKELEFMLPRLLEGTGRLLRKETADGLIGRVASKGGSTEEGIQLICEGRMDEMWRRAIGRAYHKGREISKEMDELN